jgi:phosphoglycolate phosphatase-like HAD superfamily hydrolase
MGVSEINDDFKTFKHHTDSYVSKTIFESNLSEEFTKEKFNRFEKRLTEKLSVQKIIEIVGAKKLIDELSHNTDYGFCFATGSLRRPAEYKLNSVGIPFEEWQLVTSDAIYDREGIVSKAIENASHYYKVPKFERIISVGDGLWDLITAKNLELEFIGVGLTNKGVLIENGAEVVYQDLTDVVIK